MLKQERVALNELFLVSSVQLLLLSWTLLNWKIVYVQGKGGREPLLSISAPPTRLAPTHVPALSDTEPGASHTSG